MTENLKKLLEEASKNEELRARLTVLTDRETAVAQTIEIAREYGIEMTEADFQPEKITELDEDEAETVAGGARVCGWIGTEKHLSGNCVCVYIGAATGCGCFIIGGG